MTSFNLFTGIPAGVRTVPVKISSRSFRSAIEEALIHSYTRRDLEVVLAEELKLPWPLAASNPTDGDLSKREVIQGYTDGWDLPRLAALARRITAELEVTAALLEDLEAPLNEYERGGVGSPAKNLIFAANGPKPDLVLRDAISNDIGIVRNAEFCLIYDQPIPAEGLTYSTMIEWWRKRQGFGDAMPARDVGLDLHLRLRSSLADNPVELRVFNAYRCAIQERVRDPGPTDSAVKSS